MVILYSVILVEDDYMQRELLKRILLSAYESVKIYEADSESSALDIIENNDINMFFIDISLKESSGLNLAIKIRSIPKYEFRQIIFLTTNVEYILQAFKQIHCYDYLLKPYNKDEIQAIFNKIISNEISSLDNRNDNLNQTVDREILINLKNGIYMEIKLADIIFIEIKVRNCEITTAHGVYISNNMSLKKILELIDCKDIIQSHRAFAINKNYICKIEKLDIKLNTVHFYKTSKTALLGYKFKDNILSEFKKGKALLC